jgi:Tfp pilus assembly protein PilF
MQAAISHYRAGSLEEARALFERVLRMEPKHPDALHLLGMLWCARGDSRKGVQLIRRAIAFSPKFHDALSNLGCVLQSLGRDEEALASFDKALAIRPDSIEAINNRGNTLQVLGRIEEALACFDKALAIRPDHAPSLNNRGNALRCLGRLKEALAAFERALAIEPDSADTHWNESLCLLADGDFIRGWERYEWRWQTRIFARSRRNFRAPVWLGGENLSGKTVLLHGEQGLGDTLQFCRFAPAVAARGARVILSVHAALRDLLRSLPGIACVIGEDDVVPPFDFHCPIMSLPFAFGTRVETIPAHVPYLTSDPVRTDRWRERLGTPGGLKVGIVWAGQPDADRVDERRSMPLERMLGLNTIPGVTLVSIQKGDAASQSRALGPSAGLIDHTDELADFVDTAALVTALDLVISVDTSVAHLAGSLARPVWVLNRFDRCWRWLRDRDDSPWYPTMRLFTQPSLGDWGSVMDSVAADLRQFSEVRRSPNA